jgi:hypothetical protein
MTTLRACAVDEKAQCELQRHVWDFVDDRKAAGWTPERVIIAVKEVAREAGFSPSTRRRPRGDADNQG